MQHIAEHSLRLLLEFRLRREDRRHEMVMVTGLMRTGRQHMKFLQNPALHLISSLIGKGYRQDVPVCIPVLALKQKGNVFSCQSVGLSRTCRSLHYLKHSSIFIIVRISS